MPFRFFTVLMLSTCIFAQQRIISHVSRASGGFVPTILTANTDPEGRHDVTFTFYNQTGSEILSNQITVQAGETFYAPPEQISGSSDVSHIAIVGDPEVVVTVIYTSTAENSSPVHVNESETQSRRWRLYQGNWNAAWDGIAVVNPSNATASMTITQFVSGTPQTSTSSIIDSWEKVLLVLEDAFTSIDGSYFEITSDTPLALTSLRGSRDQRFLWENHAIALPYVDETNEPYSIIWQSEIEGSIRAGGQITQDAWYHVTQGPAQAHRIDLDTGAVTVLPLPGDIADVWEKDDELYFLTDMDASPDGYAHFDAIYLASWNPDRQNEVVTLTSILPHHASEIGWADGDRLFVQSRFCDETPDSIVAVEVSSGAIMWNETFLDCSLHFYIEGLISVSSPWADGDQMLLIDQSDGNVVKTWETPGSLVVSDGESLYGTLDRENVVIAMDMTGNIIWQYDTSFSEVRPRLTSHGLLTYIFGKPTGKRNLVMLDPLDGEELWVTPEFLTERAYIGFSDEKLYVGSGDMLYILNAANGHQEQVIPLSSWGLDSFYRNPHFQNNVLYTESRDGNRRIYTAIRVP